MPQQASLTAARSRFLARSGVGSGPHPATTCRANAAASAGVPAAGFHLAA